MSRRHSGFYSALRATERVARQVAAAQRRGAAMHRRQAAAAARAVREADREKRRLQALQRVAHLGNRQAEVDALNRDLSDQVSELASLLASGLAHAGPLDFELLKHEPDTTQFDPGKLGIAEPAPSVDKYLPPPLEGLHTLLPW